MQTKICNRCKLDKSEYEFSIQKGGKCGLSSKCKKCLNELGIIHRKENLDKCLANELEYRKNNRIKMRAAYKRWYEKPGNKQKKNTKENVYQKNRKKTDPLYKLKANLTCSIHQCIIRKNKWVKGGRSEQLLGASFEMVKQHIERQFKKGMSWKNHGKGEDKWHIDHRIPLASANNVEDMRLLCHYTNLQPLWEKDNLRKQDFVYNEQLILPI